MRITQQHVVQQALNASGNTKALNQLVGQVLQGQIANIQSNQLATLVMGSQKLTVDINGLGLTENQMVQLEIVAVNDGTLVGKLVGDAPHAESADAMGELLKKFGVPDQLENRLILETMKQAGLPINQKTFQLMRQGALEVKALQMELKNSKAPVLEQALDMPIKALALKLINEARATDVDVKLVQPSQSTLSQISAALESETAPSQVTSSQVVQSQAMQSQAIQSQVMASETLKLNAENPNSVLPNETKDLALLEAIKLAFVDTKNSVETLDALLSKFDLKQESLLIKNDLPMTLKNIFIAYEAFSENGGLGHRFSNLLNQLEEIPFTKVASEQLLQILLEDEALPEKIEKLASKLSEILPEGEPRKQVESELAVIKESSALIKSYNDQVMMMQLPIKMESQYETVELFLKKKKGQFNPDDLTLLVALNTHHMGEVRCLIHKVNQSVQLMFSVEDEAIKQSFEGNKQVLTDALDMHKGLTFNVQFGVNAVEKQDWHALDIQDPVGFDIKV